MINFLQKHKRFIRFLVAGGTAAMVDLLFLYLFTDVFKIWYLGSAVLAFLFAFVVSFGLQKFWTFKGDHHHQSRAQLLLYLSINLINLGLNSLGLYLLVDKLGAWYLLSQVIMSGLLAFESYFIYKLVVFKEASIVIPAKAGIQAR